MRFGPETGFNMIDKNIVRTRILCAHDAVIGPHKHAFCFSDPTMTKNMLDEAISKVF